MNDEIIKLASGFHPAREAEWLALAEKALKGASPAEALTCKSDDGIAIRALEFRPDDAATVPAVPGMRTGCWDIRQAAMHPDPAEANAEMLADLAGGATSVAIYLNHGSGGGEISPSGVLIRSINDLEQALDGVLLDVAGVSLIGGPRAITAASSLVTLWHRRGIADEDAIAQFNIDPIGHMAASGGSPDSLGAAFDGMAEVALTSATRWPGVRAVAVTTHAYHSAGCGEVQELAIAIATGVQYLRVLEECGLGVAKASRELVFRVAADADIFLSIAKLRALRQLWARVLEASAAASATSEVHIEAISAPRMYAAPSPAMNILRGTSACLAAVMGGADAITILPHTLLLGLPDRAARRIARNVQVILEDESSLARVADPAAGSYSIEALTGQLAGAAWELFQEIEAGGGIVGALASGRIQDQIGQVAAKRQQALEAGERILVGVNGYTDPAGDRDEAWTEVGTPDLEALAGRTYDEVPAADAPEAILNWPKGGEPESADVGVRPLVPAGGEERVE